MADPAAPTAGAAGVRALFNPTSIALVGATDKSGWSLNTHLNLKDFPGEVYLVNPRSETVHGRPAYPSLSALPGPVDLVYVMTPTRAVIEVMREGAGLGIRSYVVLTAGFGETGAEGRALEDEIAAYAAEHGLTVLGPNGNGYINAAAGVTPYGLPIPAGLPRGSVGVVLQSGALASAVMNLAMARSVGVSLLTSMGNETQVTVTDVLGHLVDDPETKVIALFLESIRRPDEFSAIARRALAAGKPIVALKIGRSSLAKSTAQAHTGALVGDDRVIDAAFAQLGVVRVRSLEDLIVTAGLLAQTGPLPGRRIGVVTPSGGASEIIADRAEDEGLDLPPWAPATVSGLSEILPDFATVQNPLDVTGYVVVDRTLLGRALDVATADPGIDMVMLLSELPRIEPPDPEPVVKMFTANAERINGSPKPIVVISNAMTDVSAFGREVARRSGFPYVAGGIEHGMTALGAALRWSETYRRARAAVPAQRGTPVRVPGLEGSPRGVWAEHRAAGLLSAAGLPVVPSALVETSEEAAAAADRLGYPVVVKAAAEGLAHKSDIGGVRLGLGSAAEVRDAGADVLAAMGKAEVDGGGLLVQPQRSGGVELLVGVVRDASWGLTLAVGLGGVWVEVLKDTALRLLPVDAAEVRRALDELRGVDLLRGARGSRAADLDAVADVVARIGALAAGLGDRLESLEINPLLVRGSEVEALDTLIIWRD
ncbi:MAG: CoA-binding protein [Streptosporangiales bacterium]|nr:CoA-binding protein [Streptosporangiales bacterium]